MSGSDRGAADLGATDLGAYLFGPFRIDPVRRVLTRNGAAIALTPTLFDTLLYLAEHPGRVVSKDELFDAIWPGRVVSESNISQTIFALRKALGDEARQDRLIVTAPGQGYRFTAAVTREVEAAGDGAVAPTPAPASPPQSQPQAEVRPAGNRRGLAIAVGAGVLVAAAGAAVMLLHPWRPANARSLVVLAEFQNQTGEAIFDRTLGKALEIDLMQSPVVSVLPERQVQDTLALMARSRDEILKPALAGEVCVRNDGQAVLEGAIAALGPKYLITLTATDCAGTTTLAAEKTVAGSREAVIAALDELAAGMRRRLGESGGSVRRFGVPLARQKTASLAALKAYSEGNYLFNHGQRLEAIPLFQHAVELDPAFATAFDDLGRVYSNLHQTALAREAIRKAYALRDTVSERERFHIIANYNEIVARDFNLTLRNLKLWSETYPSDGVPVANLANAENWLGHYPEAIEAGRRALALRPNSEASYVVLARALMHAGRLDEAATVAGQAVAKALAGDDTHGLLEEIAFARNDEAAARKELDWAKGKPAEIRLTSFAADHALRLGQTRRALSMFAHVGELSRAQGLTDYNLPPTARELFDLGLADQARAVLAQVPPETDSADYRFDLAEFGDGARAEALLARDIQETPTDTLLIAVSASEVRAAAALRRGKPTEAIAALEPAAQYELKNYDIPYLRGRAWLAAGDGARAAAEFRKILSRPGLDPTSPLYPLALLGAARALKLTGDMAGAGKAYEAFLAAWTHADPDSPALLAARAEYAAVRGRMRPL